MPFHIFHLKRSDLPYKYPPLSRFPFFTGNSHNTKSIQTPPQKKNIQNFSVFKWARFCILVMLTLLRLGICYSLWNFLVTYLTCFVVVQQKEAANNDGEKKPAADAGVKKDDGVLTVVLKMELHCEGCAKKVKRVIKHYEGN